MKQALTNDTIIFRPHDNEGPHVRAPTGPKQIRLSSGRSSCPRHSDREEPLVFESAPPMAHDRIFRTLGRRQEASDFISEVVVAAAEPAVVPGSAGSP